MDRSVSIRYFSGRTRYSWEETRPRSSWSLASSPVQGAGRRLGHLPARRDGAVLHSRRSGGVDIVDHADAHSCHQSFTQVVADVGCRASMRRRVGLHFRFPFARVRQACVGFAGCQAAVLFGKPKGQGAAGWPWQKPVPDRLRVIIPQQSHFRHRDSTGLLAALSVPRAGRMPWAR